LDDLEVGLTKVGELVEELVLGPACEPAELGEAVKRLKRSSFTMLQNDPGTRNPVRLLAMDEMAHDVQRTPGVGTFVGRVPRRAGAAEEDAHHGRRALQNVECRNEIEIYRRPPLLVSFIHRVPLPVGLPSGLLHLGS
jgi:hypothetical protein